MIEDNSWSINQLYHNNDYQITSYSIYAIPEILLVCFLWRELIITCLYPLDHCNNTLFIPKQHAHKESDSPGAVSSLLIDVII